MNKKFISLLLALVMVLSSALVVNAAETLPDPDEADIPVVTGAEAIAKVGTENAVVIDLRAKEHYEAGHLKNTYSMPVCLENFSVTTTTKNEFINSAKAIEGIETKEIYLVCYVGTFCVNHAANWLINDMGIDASHIFRVSGGVWNDSDLRYNGVFVSPAHALAQVEAGGSIILDVRATDVAFEKGYIDGSYHVPLFNYVNGANQPTNLKDDLADNFRGFVKANKELFDNNKIYILCNSGSKGAANGMALLSELGYTVANTIANSGAKNPGTVFSIEGGGAASEYAFVQQKFISGTETVAITGTATKPSATDAKAVVIDVRAVERYDVGHLKSVESYPLFTADGQSNIPTSGYDELAKNFLAKVEENAAKFAGKDIYIVCNSGATGARNATKLLMQAGYSNENIYTVKGGAKGITEDMSVPQNSKFVSPAQAESVVGNDAYVILDVRAVERYELNTLKDAVNVPLFTADGENNIPVAAPYEDELSMAFKQYVADNKEELAGKTIYILCNSGETGARNATTLLNEAGLVDNVFSIDGGAKALGLNKAPVVTPDEPETDDPVVDEPETDAPEADDPVVDEPETDASEADDDTTSTPKTGDTAPVMGYVLVMLAALAIIVNRKRFAK